MSGRSRQDSPSPPPPSDHQTDQQLSINPRAVAAEQARSKSNLKKSGANLSGSSEGSSKRVLLSETVSVSNSALDNQTHHRHLAAMGSSSSQKNLPTSTKSSSDINKVASKSNLERNPSKLGGGSWTTTADQEPNVGSEDQLISKSLNGLPIATATTVAAAPRNRSPPKNRGMTAESYTSGGRALTPLSKPQRLWAELRLQVVIYMFLSYKSHHSELHQIHPLKLPSFLHLSFSEKDFSTPFCTNVPKSRQIF